MCVPGRSPPPFPGWDQSFQSLAQELSGCPVTIGDTSSPIPHLCLWEIRADNLLIVMFAQSLIDLSSHPDLCVNTQEARHHASLQSLPLAQRYLPRGSSASGRPWKPGEAEA